MMDLLARGARDLGLTLTDEQLRLFASYSQALVAWNDKVNLTAITDPDQIQVRHFLDSLSVLRAFPGATDTALACHQPLHLIDVGTGAGFPGLALRIACPNLSVTLLEATGKRTAFLREMVTVLNLTGVTIITGRAEDVGQQPEHRETYDIAVARAVARLATLAELCLPFVKVGGRFVAMKGADVQAELDEARRAILVLGGQVQETIDITLPDVPEQHTLVVVDKVAPTPPKYPRRSGMPAKRPL